MKPLLLFLLCFCSIIVYGQDLPVKDGKVFYEEIDSANGTKDQLYQKSKLWFVNEFKNAKSVLQIDDKENGQLVGKGIVITPTTFFGVTAENRTRFTVKADVKQNKYRLQIYDILLGGGSMGDFMPVEDYTDKTGNNYRKLCQAVDKGINGVIRSYKQAIAKGSDSSF